MPRLAVDQDERRHLRGLALPPALAILANDDSLVATRSRVSLDRASLNMIRSERSKDRPPADKGVLTASGRPIRSQARPCGRACEGGGFHLSADATQARVPTWARYLHSSHTGCGLVTLCSVLVNGTCIYLTGSQDPKIYPPG